MNRKIEKIESNKAPAAIGPYSQAIVAGDYIFVSGQIPLDPATGAVVQGGIKNQTTQVLQNLLAILIVRNLTFENVVKTEIFLTSMVNFGIVNEVYESFFDGDIKPARYVVEVSKLPKDVEIEISCTAFCMNRA